MVFLDYLNFNYILNFLPILLENIIKYSPDQMMKLFLIIFKIISTNSFNPSLTGSVVSIFDKKFDLTNLLNPYFLLILIAALFLILLYFVLKGTERTYKKKIVDKENDKNIFYRSELKQIKTNLNHQNPRISLFKTIKLLKSFFKDFLELEKNTPNTEIIKELEKSNKKQYADFFRNSYATFYSKPRTDKSEVIEIINNFDKITTKLNIKTPEEKPKKEKINKNKKPEQNKNQEKKQLKKPLKNLAPKQLKKTEKKKQKNKKKKNKEQKINKQKPKKKQQKTNKNKKKLKLKATRKNPLKKTKKPKPKIKNPPKNKKKLKLKATRKNPLKKPKKRK